MEAVKNMDRKTKIKIFGGVAFVILVCFFFIFKSNDSGVSIKESSRNEPLFLQAQKLYNEKQYPEAYALYYQACDKGNGAACVSMAFCYRNGQGVTQDVTKALNIFKKFSSKDNIAALGEATTLEYYIGTTDALENAFKLYDRLSSSPVGWVAKEANEAKSRIPTYNFLMEFLPLDVAYTNKRISYQKLESGMMSLTINNITPNMRDKFVSFRNAYLEDAKNGDNIISDIAVNSGKVFMETLTGGYIGFAKGLFDTGKMIFGWSDASDRAKKLAGAFYEALAQEKISAQWYNNFINDLKKKYPKK